MPNKEQMASDQKSKKSTLTMAIENNPCGMCRAGGYPNCKGHGGSGGGGSGGGGGDSGENKNTDATYSNKASSTLSQASIAAIKEFDNTKTIWIQSQLSSDRTINYEAGLLSIESDRLRGNLTFKVKPGLTKDELELSRQFLKVVKAEFDEFKNQLTEKGISTSNFTATLKDDELAIKIPNPKYYDAFIKHLENKNLLPIPNPDQEKKEVASKSYQEKTRPSPFGDILKGPKPKGVKKD